MGKVLITGASGFTGGHLAAELAAHGFECVGLTSASGELLPPNFGDREVADLLDTRSLADVVQRVKPQFVIHLAAIAFVGHGEAEAFYRTNVVGTRNLLQALAALPVRPVMTLLASSANIYGNACADIISEGTPAAPANDYAVSKLAMEYMARLYMERLPIALVRPFNYTGAGQSENFLVPKIVAHARRKAPTLELGNLDVERDFSDVRTIASCYRRLLSCPAAAGLAVNVCSGRTYSLREILNLVEELSGHRFAVTVNPAFVRANEVKVLRGSPSRLQSLIGPITGIELAQTLTWMLQAPPAAPLP